MKPRSNMALKRPSVPTVHSISTPSLPRILRVARAAKSPSIRPLAVAKRNRSNPTYGSIEQRRPRLATPQALTTPPRKKDLRLAPPEPPSRRPASPRFAPGKRSESIRPKFLSRPAISTPAIQMAFDSPTPRHQSASPRLECLIEDVGRTLAAMESSFRAAARVGRREQK